MNKVILPLTVLNGKITLPIILPMTFTGGIGDGSVKLPMTLPVTFAQSSVQRTSVKLTTSVTCQFANEKCSIKLPVLEKVNGHFAKIPVQEQAWVFVGFLMEENVVEAMTTPLILIEDIRSRILTEYAMVNGNDIQVKWFGDEVPMVEVYKKLSLDEVYEKVGTYEWLQEKATITLGHSEHNIMLKGINSTGESSVYTIGEPTFIEIDTILDLPLNEKMYDFDIEYTGTYKIEIDY